MAINGHTLAHHHTELGHSNLIHMQQILTKFQGSSQGMPSTNQAQIKSTSLIAFCEATTWVVAVNGHTPCTPPHLI